MVNDPIYWTDMEQTCVIDGKGYRVDKNLKTYCIGPVKVEKPVRDNPPNRHQTNPVAKNAVAKIDNKGNIVPAIFATQKTKGRPRKTGEVSRFTKWRREKEKQLAMQL